MSLAWPAKLFPATMVFTVEAIVSCSRFLRLLAVIVVVPRVTLAEVVIVTTRLSAEIVALVTVSPPDSV